MSETNIAEVINTGIQIEGEGLKVYEDAAARSTHPFAKQMFASLANDERRHAEWFRRLGEDMGVAASLLKVGAPDDFKKSIQGIFKELREQIEGKPADTNDVEVIRVALGLEEKSYDLYSGAAENASGDVKDVLLRIAAEENNHYKILDDVLLYLTDPEKWNIKEENPVIDG